jgi:hypothetical protein
LVWNFERELADAPLLGVTGMAVESRSSAGEAATIDDGIVRAIELLREALDLLDQVSAPPDIGAHVQTAIDAAEHRDRQVRPDSL